MKTSFILSLVLATALIQPILAEQENQAAVPPPAKPHPNETAPAARKKSPPEMPKRGRVPKDRPRIDQNHPHPESRLDPRERSEQNRTRAWFGVATIPVPPALAQHLRIPEGFGIQVIEVSPDSPAAKSGIQESDILLRLDDQRLISPEHLALLIREKSKGDSVSFTVIQNGNERTLTAILDETDEPLLPNRSVFESIPPMPLAPPQWLEELRREARKLQSPVQRNWRDRRGHTIPEARPEATSPGLPKTPERPQNRAPQGSVSPGLPLRIFGDEGVLRINNDEGELTLTRKNEVYRLELRDKQGNSIYDGPYSPAKGKDALPMEAQKLFEAMKLDRFDFRISKPHSVNPRATQKEKTTPPATTPPAKEHPDSDSVQ